MIAGLEHLYGNHFKIAQLTVTRSKSDGVNTGLPVSRREEENARIVAEILERSVFGQRIYREHNGIPIGIVGCDSINKGIPLVEHIKPDGIEDRCPIDIDHRYLNLFIVRELRSVGVSAHKGDVINAGLVIVRSKYEVARSIPVIGKAGIWRDARHRQIKRASVRIGGICGMHVDHKGITFINHLVAYGIDNRRLVDVYHRYGHIPPSCKGRIPVVTGIKSDVFHTGRIIIGDICKRSNAIPAIYKGRPFESGVVPHHGHGIPIGIVSHYVNNQGLSLTNGLVHQRVKDRCMVTALSHIYLNHHRIRQCRRPHVITYKPHIINP